jgi:RNA polymerase sigma-70 factor, ECF subfamily
MMTVNSTFDLAPWFGSLPSPLIWMSKPALTAEQEILRSACQGDEDAITLLVNRHSPRLFRFLCRLIGDPAAAEDLVQDTWLRVIESLDKYDPQHAFSVWILTIARNLATDALRKKGRQGTRVEAHALEDGTETDPVDLVPDNAPSVLEQLSDEDLQQRVATGLAGLPIHYREVLLLRFDEELKIEEVARALEIPLSTAKTRLHRGLAILRQRLEAAI